MANLVRDHEARVCPVERGRNAREVVRQIGHRDRPAHGQADRVPIQVWVGRVDRRHLDRDATVAAKRAEDVIERAILEHKDNEVRER